MNISFQIVFNDSVRSTGFRTGGFGGWTINSSNLDVLRNFLATSFIMSCRPCWIVLNETRRMIRLRAFSFSLRKWQKITATVKIAANPAEVIWLRSCFDGQIWPWLTVYSTTLRQLITSNLILSFLTKNSITSQIVVKDWSTFAFNSNLTFWPF